MTENITCNILQINIYDSNYWKIYCIMKSKRHFSSQKKTAHTNYLYMHLKIKLNSVRIKFLSWQLFCSTLNGIRRDTFDSYSTNSLCPAPSTARPYPLYTCIYIYYIYTYTIAFNRHDEINFITINERIPSTQICLILITDSYVKNYLWKLTLFLILYISLIKKLEYNVIPNKLLQ